MVKYLFSAFADEASPNLSEQIKACKENGIQYIEARNINDKNISEYDEKSILPVKQELEKNGIKISSIGSPYGKIKITDDFDLHFEKFKKTVKVANVLGVKYIRIFSFYFESGMNYDEYRDEVIRRVGLMVDYAEKNGVICCHENEKDIYGETAERCLDLLKSFDGRLKAVFDPANFICGGLNSLESYKILEPYIEYMHIKDCVSDSKKIVPAGKGDGSIPEILKRYKTFGNGKCFLSLEPHLKVFSGLKDLEGKNRTNIDDDVYPTNRAAFDTAFNAIKEIVLNLQ